jgi:hypothetical protein
MHSLTSALGGAEWSVRDVTARLTLLIKYVKQAKKGQLLLPYETSHLLK